MIDFSNTRLNDEDEIVHQLLHTTPLFYKGIGERLTSSISIDDVDRLITVQGIRYPNLHLLNSKKGLQTLPSYPFSEEILRLYSPFKIFKQFIAEGTTFMLHDLHKYHLQISALHQQVMLKFRHIDKTTGFLSPPNSQATKPHADDHPNIVVQISGSKRWLIWERIMEDEIKQMKSVNEMEKFLVSKSNLPPLLDVKMKPGDLLVVPQRFLHTALSLNEHSFSIVFQIRCCCIKKISNDIFEDLFEERIHDKHFIQVIE